VAVGSNPTTGRGQPVDCMMGRLAQLVFVVQQIFFLFFKIAANEFYELNIANKKFLYQILTLSHLNF
jgi:hypothetical protein